MLACFPECHFSIHGLLCLACFGWRTPLVLQRREGHWFLAPPKKFRPEEITRMASIGCAINIVWLGMTKYRICGEWLATNEQNILEILIPPHIFFLSKYRNPPPKHQGFQD